MKEIRSIRFKVAARFPVVRPSINILSHEGKGWKMYLDEDLRLIKIYPPKGPGRKYFDKTIPIENVVEMEFVEESDKLDEEAIVEEFPKKRGRKAKDSSLEL